MPLGRYPGRVKQFKEWANKEVNKAELTNSATGTGKRASRGKPLRTRRRKRRLRRRKRRLED